MTQAVSLLTERLKLFLDTELSDHECHARPPEPPGYRLGRAHH